MATVDLEKYFLQATESAAIAASKWIGKGDGKAADGAAVEGDGDYVSIDNLSLSIEADDGSGFVVQGSIYGRESGGSPDRENFPVIVKTDNSGEMQYYLALNYNTDTSKFYSWELFKNKRNRTWIKRFN